MLPVKKIYTDSKAKTDDIVSSNNFKIDWGEELDDA